MTEYELMKNTNYQLIKGDEPTENQKLVIVNQFINAISGDKVKQRFYNGVNTEWMQIKYSLIIISSSLFPPL